MSLTYTDADPCILPDLVAGQRFLAPGTVYQCLHRTWQVQWMQAWGGRMVPTWISVVIASAVPFHEDTAPSTPIPAGGWVYVDAVDGALKYLGPNATRTTIAPA